MSRIPNDEGLLEATAAARHWSWVLVLSGSLACSPMTTPDAGTMPVDAGPSRVVDGGLVGPFARGEVLVSQSVREVGTRSVFSSHLSASFLEVGAPTPSPCVERREGSCVLRVCNQTGAIVANTRTAGAITWWGLLPLERDAGSDGGLDGGAADGGVDGGEDGGALDGGWLLHPNDAGLVGVSAPQRLFFAGSELSATASGGDLPAFSTPTLLAPAQLTLTTPRCVPACPPLPRDTGFDVGWSGVGEGDVFVQLTTPQVTVTCSAPATSGTLTVPPSLMAELTPSVSSGEATMLVKTRTSVQFDAGGFDVAFAAETPALFPVTVLP